MSTRTMKLPNPSPSCVQESVLFDEAREKYLAEDSERPFPSSLLSTVERHGAHAFVVLRNVNGVLAVFRLEPNGSLRGLDTWSDDDGRALVEDPFGANPPGPFDGQESTSPFIMRDDGKWMPAYYDDGGCWREART